ncbi:MAG: fluoride efflux transporter CrcB [Actinobacteria bacterium]|nr:fluoride efflux transporter CrcB [Actinomycetota bacterium]
MSAVLLWAGVALLGGVGAVARFALSTAVARRGAGWFPWGTLAVNLSGSALLGLVAGLALHGDALTLVAGGLLGSYTTFSTWMLDSERLGEHHSGRALTVNLLGSVLLGLAAVALGRALGGL